MTSNNTTSRGGAAQSGTAAPGRFICPEGVICGSEITKEKRKEMFGSVDGGSGSTKPEKWQREMIERGTGVPCKKTHMRINLETNEMIEIVHPNKKENGFDYTENFDGKQEFGTRSVFINLKCISDKGGAQTRSLREVYWFVKGQLKILNTTKEVYFANILDGDGSSDVFDKFNYLLSQPEYKDVKDSVYVGDLKNYFAWLSERMM